MARIDQAPEERDTTPLTITNVIDCPECGEMFDHIYSTAGTATWDVEELTDLPVEQVTCPDCGHAWEREAEAWHFHSDA